MARAKGRDVLIELMDSVAQIQATTARHADLLETLAAQAVSIAHRVQSLERQVQSLERQVHELERQVHELGSEVHELAQGFVQSAELSRTLQQQVGRMARTLGDFAGGSATRLKAIEQRLDRLERKAG